MEQVLLVGIVYQKSSDLLFPNREDCNRYEFKASFATTKGRGQYRIKLEHVTYAGLNERRETRGQ